MRKNSQKIKEMVAISSLGAIVAVLQYISMFIKFGPFNITLALTPIVVGAIIYGPKAGGILGFIMGLVVLLTNSEAFFVVNPIATIFLCILKSTVAGFLAGYIYKWGKNKTVSTIISSVSMPIINTLIFAIGCLLFFVPTLREWAAGEEVLVYLFVTMIGLQFVVELVINSIVSPIVIRLTEMFKK